MRVAHVAVLLGCGVLSGVILDESISLWRPAVAESQDAAESAARESNRLPPDLERAQELRRELPMPDAAAPFVARGRRTSEGFIPLEGGAWVKRALPTARAHVFAVRRGVQPEASEVVAAAEDLWELEKDRRGILQRLTERENELIRSRLGGRAEVEARRLVFYHVGPNDAVLVYEGDDPEYDTLLGQLREHEGRVDETLALRFPGDASIEGGR